MLRETAGVGIQFTSLKVIVPLLPTGYGREYYGGIREVAFVRRLAAHSELQIKVGFIRDYADYDLMGVDDAGRPVRLQFRVRPR